QQQLGLFHAVAVGPQWRERKLDVELGLEPGHRADAPLHRTQSGSLRRLGTGAPAGRSRAPPRSGRGPLSAPGAEELIVEPRVAVNGRAAVRRQIGGVERLATEMAVRLPEVRPERYGLIAPRPQLAHRAGQAWEQAVLPLRARAYALIYSP